MSKKLLYRIFSIIRRGIFTFFFLLLGLLFAAYLLVQLPITQQFIAVKLKNYLAEEYHIQLGLDRLRINFFDRIELVGLYLPNASQSDTLVYAEKLSIALDYLPLITQKVRVRRIGLSGANGIIFRDTAGTFNFQYLIDAFAGDEPPEEKEAQSSPWQIDFGGFDIADTRIAFLDSLSGTSLKASIGQINGTLNHFSLPENSYHIEQLSLHNSWSELQLFKGAVTEMASSDTTGQAETALPDVIVQQLTTENVGFRFNDTQGNLALQLHLATLSATSGKDFSLLEKKINLSQIKMANSSISLRQASAPSNTNATPLKPTEIPTSFLPEIGWEISVDALDLAANAFHYAQSNPKGEVLPPTTHKGFLTDFIDVWGINVLAEDISWQDATGLRLQLKEMKAREHGGMQLQNLSGHFLVSPKAIRLENLQLLAGKSRLDLPRLNATYNQQSDLLSLAPGLGVELVLNKLFLDKALLNYFAVLLPSEIVDQYRPFFPLDLQSRAAGNMRNLSVNDFAFKAAKKLSVDFTGQFFNLHDLPNIYYNFRQFSLSAQPKKIADAFKLEGDLFADWQLDDLIKANAVFSGTTDSLNLANLRFTAPANSGFLAEGWVSLRPDDNWDSDIKVDSLYLAKRFLNSVMPPEIGIGLPPAISGQGYLKGRSDRFTAGLALNSSFGDFSLNLNRNSADVGGQLSLNEMHLSQWLPTAGLAMDHLTAQWALDGQWATTDDFSINLNGQLQQFLYNNYCYQEWGSTLSANAAGCYTAELQSLDPNISFDLNGQACQTAEGLETQLAISLDRLQLLPLYFTEDDIRFKGELSNELFFTDIDHFTNKLRIKGLQAANSKQFFEEPKIAIDLSTDGQRSELTAKLGFAEAHFSANQSLAALPTAFLAYIDGFNLFASPDSSMAENKPLIADFDLEIGSPDILRTVLLQQIDSLSPVSASGRLHSANRELTFQLNVADIQYAGFRVDSLSIAANQLENQLDFQLIANSLSGAGLAIYQPTLSAQLADGVLSTGLKLFNPDGREQFALALRYLQTATGNRLEVAEEGLLVNYQPWAARPGNHIFFSPDSLAIYNFRFDGPKGQSVAASKDSVANAEVLALDVENLRLSSFGEIFFQDSSFVFGRLGAKLHFPNPKTPFFDARLKVEGFGLAAEELGELAIYLRSSEKDNYRANLALDGQGNTLRLTTDWNAREENPLNVELDVDRLSLAPFDAFSAGQLSELKGSVAGRVTANGTLAKPNLDGNLTFSDTRFQLPYLATTFQISAQQLSFAGNDVLFKKFTIQDPQGNNGTIDGKITFSGVGKLNTNLRVQTDRFLVLDSKREDNPMYYGKAIASSNINISGPIEKLKIQMSAIVEDGTDVVYIVPESDTEMLDTEGIVVFVEKEVKKPSLIEDILDEDDGGTFANDIDGLDLNMDIQVKEGAKLTIFLDPLTDDKLSVQGSGKLNFKLDPFGNIGLSGTYNIKKGLYRFTFYDVVRKEFTIAEGSSITWTGDPFTALLNITANHEVRTPPLGLVAGQISSASSEAMAQYQRTELFLVGMDMQGELLKPELSFDISVAPASAGNVDNLVLGELSRLRNNDSEMNKQVFSLLILGGFIATGDVDTGQDVFSKTATSSLSRMLSGQLNNLSNRYIKFVDLDLNLDSYEANVNGSRQNVTELELQLSRRFFNDRLQVKVGSNFNLSDNAVSQNAQTATIGDFTLEYMLTPNGTYRLKAFQKNIYDGLVDAQIAKTGVSFIFTKDYDSLKEIFGKEKE